MSASWRTHIIRDISNVRHNLPILLHEESEDLREEIQQLKQLLRDIDSYHQFFGQVMLADALHMDETLDRMSHFLASFPGVTPEGRENVFKNSEVCTWEVLVMKDDDEEWTCEFEVTVEGRLKKVMDEFEVFWGLYQEAERELEELRRLAIKARWEEVGLKK
jgi:hypothetical protein